MTATIGVQHGQAATAITSADIACGGHVTTVRPHIVARNAGPAPPIDTGHPQPGPEVAVARTLPAASAG